MRFNWDFAGMFTSILCAVHCAILPFLAGISTLAAGISWIKNSFFEWLMIALSICIGAYAMTHGYKKHHKRKQPLLIFIVAVLLLLSKQLFKSIEIFLLIPAVLLILIAHYQNYTLANKS